MDLQNIKGIGDKTIKSLNKLNIYNIDDLVNYYPFRYQTYNIKKLSSVSNNENCTIIDTVESNPQVDYLLKLYLIIYLSMLRYLIVLF